MLDHQEADTKAYLSALSAAGFTGDIGDDLATRLVGSTDNSIYHVEPDAVIFPANAADVALATRLSVAHDISITARGGGTGTNGQSLNRGVVVDMSRHMTKIRALDLTAGTVTVEPGVVLDQLNAHLSPHGVFFAPTVSTASRATLGGMFATDASGKGSRIYGRTSDHVAGADVVLGDGRQLKITPPDAEGLSHIATDLIPRLASHAEEISRHFPSMNRGLTGYNLDQARGTSGLDFIKLIAGSEGTLALTTQLILRLTPLPETRALAVLAYESCAAALAHVPHLVSADPAAIEFLDDKIIALAAASPMWSELEVVLGKLKRAGGFLFVEFTGTEDQVHDGLARLNATLSRDHGAIVARADVSAAADIAALWEMRKRSVGLLAAMEGGRVGIPFVEDAAVPPKNLSAFVAEFSALLDAHGLDYGMFGHADVGCVHVRPMLDMRDADDRARIREISDQVAALCQRHGGLIWGEHGKGFRGEYVERYVGPKLYTLMRHVKTLFDPDNRLNPGKIAAPEGAGDVDRIDAIPMRGARDTEITAEHAAPIAKALACNGNGACHNWAPDDPMCPSYKVTGDKRLGPKGRATLLREWARRKSEGGDRGEIEAALHSSMESCLSCKSCTGQCPVRIDIPAMKSRFLADYYNHHKRPIRDLVLGIMEPASLLARRWPRLANLAMINIMTRAFNLTDVPCFSIPSAEIAARNAGARVVRPGQEPRDWGENPACIVTYSFTGVFETQTLADAVRLLAVLGHNVWVTPPLANGKPLQVRGFLDAFEQTRQRTGKCLNALENMGVPLISLDPAITDLFTKDYGNQTIQSLDRFLHDGLESFPELPAASTSYSLFLHCTEKTSDPATGRRWRAVFEHLGLDVSLPSTGCCGMAGLFGHQIEHQRMSRDIYDLSWRAPVEDAENLALATGFSCRCQVKRFGSAPVRHPAAALADRLIEHKTQNRGIP